jgi:hypothetical protein
MFDTIDKIGATITVFFIGLLMGYSAIEAGVAAVVTWVAAEVVNIIRLRREIRQHRKDRQGHQG